MPVQNQSWAAYDKAHGLTPALEARAERLMRETRISAYPVAFIHHGRRLRLELVSRYGPIVSSVMLVDAAKSEAILQISKSADAVFNEATR